MPIVFFIYLRFSLFFLYAVFIKKKSFFPDWAGPANRARPRPSPAQPRHPRPPVGDRLPHASIALLLRDSRRRLCQPPHARQATASPPLISSATPALSPLSSRVSPELPTTPSFLADAPHLPDPAATTHLTAAPRRPP